MNVTQPSKSKQRIVFLSTCPEAWGGSEELWAGAAIKLAAKGYEIIAFVSTIKSQHPRIDQLKAAGVSVDDYLSLRLPRRFSGLHNAYHFSGLYRFRNKVAPLRPSLLPISPHAGLVKGLKTLKPDLVVISQGSNFDGLSFAEACQTTDCPYVLICQKASETIWPLDDFVGRLRSAFGQAKRVFFVSKHNQTLTSRQIGQELDNSEVVRNPFLAATEEHYPWPENDGKFRLACVARLHIAEKGQDLLLEVLAQEKWKQRNLEVNLYGQGANIESLKAMAKMLSLSNVHFCGFVDNITDVWRKHHALVLPSRAEGLPLALVEAMLCGRFGIVTDVGGNSEVFEDNKSGFLAAGATVAALDEALERAWQRRDEWQKIGCAAANHIRTMVPADPCQVFSEKIEALRATVATG